MHMEVREYGRAINRLKIPNLCEVQTKFYAEFLQADTMPSERRKDGLQELFEEAFPIKSYDEKISLEFIEYDIGEPRHSPDECRQLGLTYGAPLKIRLRLNKEQPIEEDVYLGNIPLMIGGGEFIINGAERVIVSQIQRSPGTDFEILRHPSGKKIYTCRIIPERGSWIQIETTSKDIIYIRIDRTSRICGTTFLRALSEKYSTTADILRAFYPTYQVSLAGSGKPERPKKAILIADAVDPETGEVVLSAFSRLTDEAVEKLRQARIKSVEVIQRPDDELILNTLAEDDAQNHQEARLKIYARMRPGNPAQIEKANELFKETFFDDKRYNFGRIGRFRINRKFGLDTAENVLTLTAEDYFNCLNYLLKMRSDQGVPDDIDHLGNRRVRTIKDLIADEFRKGLLKMRRAVREKMSVNKEATDMTPRTLINSQTISSAIEHFFARGELSQVVDQSNPLSQLTHERRLSALGPGGLNRKRAGFEVRDVHPSHYGRICPIETPEGTNIGLIVSLGIYASINDYGFIVTPYAVVKNGKVTDEVVFLRGDEERQHTIAQADARVDPRTGRILDEKVNARQNETFVQIPADQVTLMDVAPRQIVGVAASLIPFLEHDDANRALMGSNRNGGGGRQKLGHDGGRRRGRRRPVCGRQKDSPQDAERNAGIPPAKIRRP
jgi:DNA-directed RNA polymerase subunit beta